jgi:hypothetical protein
VGTPNAVPTDPSVPATAVPLARLRHAASATTVPASKIDDLREYTSLFGAPGAWQDFSPTLYSNMIGTPAVISSALTYARYRYLDTHTVQAQVAISRVTGATVTTGLGVSLPVAAAFRSLNCGTLIVADASVTGQSGVAFMSADATKLIPAALDSSYLDVAPSTSIRYSVTYEV